MRTDRTEYAVKRNMKYTPEQVRLITGFAPGDEVVFAERASDEQIRWGGCDNPNKLFAVGRSYLVKDVSVHSFHTKIEIEGIKGKFNSISFRRVTH